MRLLYLGIVGRSGRDAVCQAVLICVRLCLDFIAVCAENAARFGLTAGIAQERSQLESM